MQSQKLSPLQLELLNIYSFQPDERDLVAIKKMLAEYFSAKLVNKVDEAVIRRQVSEEDIDRWINE